MRLTSKSSGKMISRAKSLTNRCQSPKGREQYLTPTYSKAWSRRIDLEHRLVYALDESGNVYILSLKGHYQD